MPYVPSKKTDGKSTDREIIDVVVEKLAQDVARSIQNNLSLIREYIFAFVSVANGLEHLACHGSIAVESFTSNVSKAIYDIGKKYGYEGAYLGELNYAITRLIQRVPQIKVKSGEWAQELRYWLYAATVEAPTLAADKTRDLGIGVSGVFEDVKDEYKRRMNVSYEAEQILKSGDRYDTPYYTRLIEVVDENGVLIGHQEVMLKRSDATLNKDLLDFQIVVRKK